MKFSLSTDEMHTRTPERDGGVAQRIMGEIGNWKGFKRQLKWNLDIKGNRFFLDLFLGLFLCIFPIVVELRLRILDLSQEEVDSEIGSYRRSSMEPFSGSLFSKIFFPSFFDLGFLFVVVGEFVVLHPKCENLRDYK